MNILGLQKTTLLDYPGHIASTIFTGGCNFRCPYCHNGDLVLCGDTMDAYSVDEIMDHLTKRQHTLTGVCVTGGEPTLQPDLYEFIAQIKSIGLPVKLDTNGSNPKLLQSLVEDRLIDYVAMDIKHCPEKYEIIVNHPGFVLSDIMASVDYLQSNVVDYEFRTTLARELHHEADILAIGDWLSGAKQYYLQPYKESEEVINPIYHPHSKDELEHFVTLLSPVINRVAVRGLD